MKCKHLLLLTLLLSQSAPVWGMDNVAKENNCESNRKTPKRPASDISAEDQRTPKRLKPNAEEVPEQQRCFQAIRDTINNFIRLFSGPDPEPPRALSLTEGFYFITNNGDYLTYTDNSLVYLSKQEDKRAWYIAPTQQESYYTIMRSDKTGFLSYTGKKKYCAEVYKESPKYHEGGTKRSHALWSLTPIEGGVTIRNYYFPDTGYLASNYENSGKKQSGARVLANHLSKNFTPRPDLIWSLSRVEDNQSSTKPMQIDSIIDKGDM